MRLFILVTLAVAAIAAPAAGECIYEPATGVFRTASSAERDKAAKDVATVKWLQRHSRQVRIRRAAYVPYQPRRIVERPTIALTRVTKVDGVPVYRPAAEGGGWTFGDLLVLVDFINCRFEKYMVVG